MLSKLTQGKRLGHKRNRRRKEWRKGFGLSNCTTENNTIHLLWMWIPDTLAELHS